MAELIFVAYNGNDVNGTALGTLTDAYDKRCGVEDNAVGNGSFEIHPDSAQAAWVTPGNYVKVWRDTISGSPLGGFWIESGGDTLGSTDEEGGERFARGGGGPIKVLKESRAWHRAVSGSKKQLKRSKGIWEWQNAHPARVLVRMLEEAKARGGLQDVSWDFSRTRDSDGVKFTSDEFDKWEIPIGMSLLELVGEMRETGLHITMSPHLVLSVWDEYENDLSATISFAAGTDIRETSEREIVGSKAVSHVLVQGTNKSEEERYRVSSSSAIKTSLGRRIEGYFPFQRTATRKILGRVGQRKLKKWKQQYDGPFTLGLLDTSGQVAGVDYVVGDTVEVSIPGIIATSDHRVAGITYVESSAGEYDPIVDFGDQLHDPATGQYMGGDRNGMSPCGCEGSGPPPGGGGGGGPAPGVPGVTPVQPGTWVFDDFNRTSSDLAWENTTGLSTVGESMGGINLARQLHEIPVPSGGAADDVKFIFGGLSAQHDGATPVIAYNPIVGYAPRIIGDVAETFASDQPADDIDIAIPDGARVGDVLLVWMNHFQSNQGGSYGSPGNYWDWTAADADYVVSGTTHGGTPNGFSHIVGIRLDATNIAALGLSGFNDVVNTGVASDAGSNLQDRSWCYAWLCRDVADMGAPDNIYRWNGSPTTTATIGSLAPTSGWTNYLSTDMTMFLSLAMSPQAISGEHDHYNEIASKSELNYYSTYDAHLVASGRLDDSATQAPLSDRTFGGGSQVQIIFALSGGPSWEGFEGHTNISHAPTMHRFRTLDGTEPDVDYVHVLLNQPSTTAYDKEANIAYATALLTNVDDYIEGSDLLFGGTNELYWYDMVGPTPDNSDFLYFGWASKGGAGDESLDGDLGTWSSPGPSVFTGHPEGFRTHKHEPLYADEIAAHAFVSLNDESNQFEQGPATRWAIKASTNASDEDGSTISTGATGAGVSMTSGAVLGGDGSGIGSILLSSENGGSPWPGGNPWFYATGDPGGLTAFGVDGSVLYATGNAGAGGDNWAEYTVFDDPGVLPFSSDDWEIEMRYRVTGVVPAVDGSLHHILLSWQYPVITLLINFDGTTGSDSIRVGSGVSPGQTDELIETLGGGNSTGTSPWGRVRLRREGTAIRAKEWADAGSEPVAWEVESEILETAYDESATTYDSVGEFSIGLVTGNDGGTAMTIEVDWVKVKTFAESGAVVMRGFVAYGDNTTTKFFIEPYEQGTLVVFVDAFATTPIAQDAEAGWFRLDRAPYGDPVDETGSSVITATYEKS